MRECVDLWSMDAERKRLKEFLEEHIPFEGLKKAGMFPKGTRKSDYEVIAERVCNHLGLKSIYDYVALLPSEIRHHEEANVITGKFPDKVDENGNFEAGGGFHIDTGKSDFECPICTCHQEIRESKNPWFKQKCKGCKRKLQIFSCPITGNLTVTEILPL